MDKFEFSDLYKFLVSAGIILVSLSILTPWFYLKEPFDLLLEKSKISLLTTDAQKIILNRQSLIATSYNVIPWASGFLLLFGVSSISWGLSKWFKKQSDIDKRDLLTTEKLKIEVNNMTPAQIKSKTEEEYQEAIDIQQITTETTPPIKEIFIASYLDIEKHLINKLTTYYKGFYNIQSNIQIEGEKHLTPRSQYDLVMASFSHNLSDYIFEFKYYAYGVTKATIRENLIKLELLTKTYSYNIKMNVRPILLIVLPDDKFNPLRLAVLKDLPDELKLNEKMVVDFINLKDIYNLDKSYFDTLINSAI